MGFHADADWTHYADAVQLFDADAVRRFDADAAPIQDRMRMRLRFGMRLGFFEKTEARFSQNLSF